MQRTTQGISEDWLSVWIGLLIFVLALGVVAGVDILGWVVTTNVWNDLTKSLAPASKAYAGMGGVVSLVVTYVVLLVLMTAGAIALKADAKRFAHGRWTVMRNQSGKRFIIYDRSAWRRGVVRVMKPRGEVLRTPGFGVPHPGASIVVLRRPGYSVISCPGVNTIGSALVCALTMAAQAWASWAITGQVS